MPVAGQRVNAGLSTAAGDARNAIAYAFNFRADGRWDVLESGVARASGSWIAGDVFRIARTSHTVSYFKNAVRVHVSGGASNVPLVLATSSASRTTTNSAPIAATVKQTTRVTATGTSSGAPAMTTVTAPMATAVTQTVRVAAGASLQAALDAAQPGAILVLDAGARYVGNFVLPARAAGGLPITLTSSANVPPAGQRVNPDLVDSLAIIETPNNLPAIDAMT
ncbi:MAG: hypothetical protein ABJC89_24210, partial [Acidobacteriota bacterium]